MAKPRQCSFWQTLTNVDNDLKYERSCVSVRHFSIPERNKRTRNRLFHSEVTKKKVVSIVTCVLQIYLDLGHNSYLGDETLYYRLISWEM